MILLVIHGMTSGISHCVFALGSIVGQSVTLLSHFKGSDPGEYIHITVRYIIAVKLPSFNFISALP